MAVFAVWENRSHTGELQRMERRSFLGVTLNISYCCQNCFTDMHGNDMISRNCRIRKRKRKLSGSGQNRKRSLREESRQKDGCCREERGART